MLSFIASLVFGVLDPLVTLPALLTTNLFDRYTQFTKQVTAAPAQEEDSLPECRYRLDSMTPLLVTLPDSRKLSYAIFGSSSSTAHTIFFLHGWPGCRIEGTYLDEPAQKLNIRIVIVDRPGTGCSTPDPRRKLLSHADDIENLAQHLKAERYGVLGVSGGGPYALACAKFLPSHKLKVVAIVCGLGPSDIGYKGMFLPNYLGWTISSHYTPYFLRWWVKREPAARLDLSRKERLDMLIENFDKSRSSMPAKDVRAFGDLDMMKVQIRAGEEVHRQGSRWWLQDMKILASDMGFRVEDIRKDLPFQLWYGRKDGNVPLQHGQEVTRRLRSGDNSEDRVLLRIKDDDTHVSIFFDYREQFLAEMAKAM